MLGAMSRKAIGSRCRESLWIAASSNLDRAGDTPATRRRHAAGSKKARLERMCPLAAQNGRIGMAAS